VLILVELPLLLHTSQNRSCWQQANHPTTNLRQYILKWNHDIQFLAKDEQLHTIIYPSAGRVLVLTTLYTRQFIPPSVFAVRSLVLYDDVTRPFTPQPAKVMTKIRELDGNLSIAKRTSFHEITQ